VLNALAVETQGPLAALAVTKPVLVERLAPALERAMRAKTTSRQPGADASAEELMTAMAKRRDRDAFVRLFELFGPRVKAYLIRQGADRATAEELAQDVMLTVWRRAALFDQNKAAVSTWVFTIARNRRIDTLRRVRRPEVDPEDPALVCEPDDPADRVVEAAQRS
jgi:RNA polymerase sigma-70 factor (ECF subfamily)